MVEQTADKTGLQFLDKASKIDTKVNTMAQEIPDGYMEQIEELITRSILP
jgi:hypothetical protein